MENSPVENILVTGGAGYIGSHIVVEILEQTNNNVLLLDHLEYDHHPLIEPYLAAIVGKENYEKRLVVLKVNMLEKEKLQRVFNEHRIDSVIHLAALKSVAESMRHPELYYRNNVGATANLLECMQIHGVRKLIFSSSATVYGNPTQMPITEDYPTYSVNPYGGTKIEIEKMLHALTLTHDSAWRIISLRYFNPIGAHPTGLIGDFQNPPSNVVPHIINTMLGITPAFTIFGTDYPTPDGTAVRDYLHVLDLARGHLAALNYLSSHADQEYLHAEKNFLPINLGTGRGISVLELVRHFESVLKSEAFSAHQLNLQYRFGEQRSGDGPICYADTCLASQLLQWKTKETIDTMVQDSIQWAMKNKDWLVKYHQLK
jgi:UDP-glucose 4-epimerase